MTKFIFITGGVLSSLGKGITGASLGALLEARGLSVAMMKMDPYLNVDPGTMSPFQHGEVFVTDDGAETDLDLGHYERFTHNKLTKDQTITSGQVYLSVLDAERRGDYLGQTVQVIPHVTDEIKKRVNQASRGAQVLIIEIGGTVGDIESQPFIEAIRQLRLEVGRENAVHIHLTYVPYVKAAHELKTKPTQHSTKELLSVGIQPDFIVCRSEHNLHLEHRRKIAMFCSVPEKAVISCPDMESIYQVPIHLNIEGLDDGVCSILFPDGVAAPDLSAWHVLNGKIENLRAKSHGFSPKVDIAVVGKYVSHADAYKSLAEAIYHAGFQQEIPVRIKWVEASTIEGIEDAHRELVHADAILIPGGFGERGIDGMLTAIRYARENKIPFFGICLGMQLTCIEYAINVCGLVDVDSTEFSPEPRHPLIEKLSELAQVTDLGGTMRLGAYSCETQDGTLAREIYGSTRISERHRHRYEFNNAYIQTLSERGLVFSGKHHRKNDDGGLAMDLMEIVELPPSVHPFYIGVQFHPEFKSKPLHPHPIFMRFVKAAMEFSQI